MFVARFGIAGLRSPQAARALVDRDVAAGYDIIKPYDDLPKEVLRALVDHARRNDAPTFCHVPRNLNPEIALAERPTVIAHAEEYLYNWFLPRLTAREPAAAARMTAAAGTAVIANLVAFDAICRSYARPDGLMDKGGLRYVPYLVRRTWEPHNNRYATRLQRSRSAPASVMAHNRRRYALLRRLVRELQAEGVRVLVGTDASYRIPFVIPGFATLEELDQLVAAGLTAYQALLAATRSPAEVLGREQEFGTIQVGRRGDLLLLRGNPLEDITNVRLAAGVLCGGRWYPADQLCAWLDEIARRYADDERAIRALIAAGLDLRPMAPTLPPHGPNLQLAAIPTGPNGVPERRLLPLLPERTSTTVARELIAEHRPEDGLAVLRYATRERPDSALCWRELSAAYLDTSRPSAAVAALENSLAFEPHAETEALLEQARRGAARRVEPRSKK